jgi:hypothetical protein
MQGIEFDDVAGGQNDRPLHDVLQLTDIARPGMLTQRRIGSGRQAQSGATGASAVIGKEMTRQRSDILASLPQRRNQQGKDVQAIEQVLTKVTPGHGVGHVAIGSGDDADIEDHRLLAADPLDFALLQDAQQLGLQAERHFGDLVEQQTAVLRLLELAGLRVLRAAEGALFVTEKGGLEQAVRNGRAIDGHERALAARRVLVNEARHHLLANAAFAGQQDRAVTLCDPPGQCKEVDTQRIDGDHPLVIVALPADDSAARVRAAPSARTA